MFAVVSRTGTIPSSQASEGLIFRKERVNRCAAFDFCESALDTGKNGNLDTGCFGAGSEPIEDTEPEVRKSRTLFSVSGLFRFVVFRPSGV